MTPDLAPSRLTPELGWTLKPETSGFTLSSREDSSSYRSALEALAALAYSTQWRDDREELRDRVGFSGPVSEVADGPRADALRWLAGQGEAVGRGVKINP